MPARCSIWLFAAGCLLAKLTIAQTAIVVSDRPVTVVETMRNDASLADVAFVDRSTGWAVGDRGVIWHTTNGGAMWAEQRSGVACRLATVCFVDAKNGWAAGSETPPLSNASRGVLLSTRDGGTTWNELDQTALPAIKQLRFFDVLHGIAAGESSPLFPSGVLVTKDGGKSWQPLPTDANGQWLAADFPDPRSGAVAGAKGRSATLMRGRVVNSTAADDSLRASRALRLLLPTDGYLVGDGGRVMTTRDLGATWQTPPGELPDIVRDNFDFQAVAATGPQVWIAGSPGTRILRSSDGGQTWRLVPTGQNAPLRAITFVDADTGFAVGDLGTILSTVDGGRSWQLQRRGGERAALFAVMPREADVPLELLGKFGAEEGYFATVSLLHPALPATDARTPQALLAAGAIAVDPTWRFPLSESAGRTPGELLDQLNRASDGRAAEQIQRYLVRHLRMWRPDVVVTPCIAESDKHPLGALVEQFVNQAIAAAADPNQQTALSDEIGLTPWQVKKVYGVLPAGWRGDEHVSAGEFAPRLGATLADWVEPARRTLAADASAPDNVELQLKWAGESPMAANSRGVFDGIQLTPGGEARRRLANLPTDDVENLRRLAMRRRQLRKLIDNSQGNAAWAAQLTHLTADLDAESAGELMFELADGYRAAGQPDMAADTYAALARQWPDHPLCEPALRWLVQFYASSEMAVRLADRSASNYRAASEPEQLQFGNVRQASAVEMLKADSAPVIGLSQEDRLQRAAAVGQYLETSRPALFAEPGVRFPLVVAQRQRGFANPAQRYFMSLSSLPLNDPWRQCALTEQWFARPEGSPPPKKLGHCRSVLERPRLDGKFDEAFWESADRLRLIGEMAEGGKTNRTDKNVCPTVRLVRDDEFLYIAAECPKARGCEYESDRSPRTRDADLAAHDRVTIEIDVDRDYTTAFELAVDCRGWTKDACWGDATWNPQWFVAASADEGAWRIEAAIPLAELVAATPTTKDVWAVSVVREIPGGGAVSWAGAVDSGDSPGRFGLLIFD